jgi:hypothetical protein
MTLDGRLTADAIQRIAGMIDECCAQFLTRHARHLTRRNAIRRS